MRTQLLTAAPARNRIEVRLPTLSRLPPMTALRAFVVAARHASFSGAAEELHVSTAAIGQQVRILETHLGHPLFNRERGDLALTEVGAMLYPGLADAFDSMVESLSGVIRAATRPSLNVVADSSFAARLLTPRLGRLRQGLADVELSITTLESRHFEPLRFDADCAIVALSEPVPGFVCLPLFDDTAIAVCTPEFAARHGLCGAPEQLRDPSVETLRDAGNDPSLEWSTWLRACGIPFRPARAGLRFSQQPLLIEATLAGHGIALLRHSLVAQEIDNGRLIMPFGAPKPTTNRYYLLTNPDQHRRPEIELLLSILTNHGASQAP